MSDELKFASENEALQHLANLTGKKIKVAANKANIEVGKKYETDSYKGTDIVTVTKINPSEKGWYDDHQEGGWWSKGIVEGIYKSDGDECLESLEYAQDFWTEVK